MRPELQAAEEEIKQKKEKSDFQKKLASTAIPTLGIAKIMPFLNPYISPEIASAGITRLFPRLGDFFSRISKNGLPLSEGINFLKEKYGKYEKPKIQENLSTETQPRQDIQPQPQEQMGPGEQALMQILQQINARLGK